MFCISLLFSRFRAIDWYQLQYKKVHQSDYIAGKTLFSIILKMKRGMHVEYSTISASWGHFRDPKKLFGTSNQKSVPKESCEMFWRWKNIYTLWSYDQYWLRESQKTEEKKVKSSDWVPFWNNRLQSCWLKLEKIQKTVFFDDNITFLWFFKKASYIDNVMFYLIKWCQNGG